MNSFEPFFIQQGSIYAIPIIHYTMEMACQVKLAFEKIKPDCITVELPETLQHHFLHAASRLPDISVILSCDSNDSPLYFMCEPCDPIFEALRSAAESKIDAFCIDLDVKNHPEIREPIPDAYAIQRLGLETYFTLYEKSRGENARVNSSLEQERELYMARRLKELSFSYERILFITGMAHVTSILELVKRPSFPELYACDREFVELCTPTADSYREIMAEWGYLSWQYELVRNFLQSQGTLDRQKIILQLFKTAAEKYCETTGNAFPGYNLRNLMKFARNYALIGNQLMPDLFKILHVAKSCVDHNYAYEVWELATAYPFYKNIDGLPELDLNVQDVWGNSKLVRFHLKEKGRKSSIPKLRKDRSTFRFRPPHPFSICSYPPEDLLIEKFGQFLKKKGHQLLIEEAARTVPFSTSLEDGIDTKETIRHWHEKKLFVKTRGRPPSGVGSVCIIFDEDKAEDNKAYTEKFPWCTTWIGEHQQESDMSFFATPLSQNVVGPGISRCEYGGFMMSYPPRRMVNVWSDADYQECRSKSEVLLMAAIDYAIQPSVVYVAHSPPRSALKSFAKRYGKKIVYIPIGQLSPLTLNKLRIFHVLDGHDRREIADEYIY